MCNPYEEKMKKLRKEDSIFSEMVAIIEGKIQRQIDSYNNTKKVNPGFENSVDIKIYVPVFPMTPIQKSCLMSYLHYQFLGKTHYNNFRLKKCILTKRYKIYSYHCF